MSTGKIMINNYLSPLEFKILIKRLPNVEFFTQRAMVPSISTTAIQQPTRFNPVFTTPDQVNFSNLDLTFIVDEAMKNYMEIFNWILSSANVESHDRFGRLKSSPEGLFSDISIIILNSKKNPNIEISYTNCFPTSLSDIQLNTTDSDVTYPEATASFSYDTFDIKHLTS
jgi:hypothetical protein